MYSDRLDALPYETPLGPTLDPLVSDYTVKQRVSSEAHISDRVLFAVYMALSGGAAELSAIRYSQSIEALGQGSGFVSWPAYLEAVQTALQQID